MIARRLLLGLALGASCRKVPIHDVGAAFALADVTWFAQEETLFVFYTVTAEQGLGDPTVVELTYTTDEGVVDWTPLDHLPPVHTHLPVDCGPDTLCGSWSVHVPMLPRDVALRMRYHRRGELALGAPTTYNVVEEDAEHRRSLLVYGVFDETNTRVQWRSRHNFPTLRNEDVTDLGLRRPFLVEGMRFGDGSTLGTDRNPYAYGVACPDDFVATGFAGVTTDERAIFQPEALPLGAAATSTVCAEATVTDATGTFTTGAVAKKNPEVREAFPVLHSPVRDATHVPFFLGPCDRVISEEHEQMQRQRLQLGDVPTTCIDGWDQPDFVDGLVATFRDAVEAERAKGEDVVLVVAVHQDELGVSQVVEQALAEVVPPERHRTSPRLAGAFVLDSDIHGMTLDALDPVALWCPADIEGVDRSARTCAVLPDEPTIDLGPFSFGTLPILPSRDMYLDFVDSFSDREAGSVTDLTFRVPEFAATADHVDLGEFGVVTFLNDEAIDADPPDAFSHCVSELPAFVVFRSKTLDRIATDELCEYLYLPEDMCENAMLPIDWLPDWHTAFADRSYELGIAWDFPFLLRMRYEVYAAGELTAFGFSVPFGIASPEKAYYGTEIWTSQEIPLGDVLLQCDRFCDHPTFDGAGVYHVTDPFRTTYAHNCYVPRYPAPGDPGFPLDP